MLIYLTNSLIVDSQDNCYNNIRIAVKNIAWAVIESKHILRGDYEILCKMRDIFKFDIDIYPLFRKLCIDYSTHTIPETIHNYVEVVRDNPIRREYGGVCIKQVTYEYFLDSSKVQAMNLVLEDDDDDIIYNMMINWYLKEVRINTNISYSVVHGGGGNVVDVAKKHIKNGIMAICITDADKRFPEQKIKSDSCCAKCAKLQENGGIYYHYFPNVLELENLIPLNYIDSLDWSGKQSAQDKKNFDILRDCATSEKILRYFDYKEGIKKKLIESEIENKKEYYEYAKLCCEQNLELLGDCTFDSYYANLKDDACVYPRLRKRIIPDIKSLLKKSRPDPVLMNFQKDEWLKMAALLVDLFCARNKESLM